ncbi:Parkin coregulated protein, partial [Globisporangium splendens]
MSRSRNESQVLSLDNPKESSGSAPSSRPPASSGRSTKQANKLSEFRQCLDRDELPLVIETRKHDGSRRVTWTSAQLEPLEFTHLLPICVSGLQDALEPYPTFAFDAAMVLLESSGKADDTRVLQALPQVMNQVKSALSTRDKAVVHRVLLLLLQQLAVCDGVGDALTEYYRSILPLCNILQDKHLGTGDDATKALVAETLETMEAYGKDDAHLLIQQYVPSFQSCAG